MVDHCRAYLLFLQKALELLWLWGNRFVLRVKEWSCTSLHLDTPDQHQGNTDLLEPHCFGFYLCVQHPDIPQTLQGGSEIPAQRKVYVES